MAQSLVCAIGTCCTGALAGNRQWPLAAPPACAWDIRTTNGGCYPAATCEEAGRSGGLSLWRRCKSAGEQAAPRLAGLGRDRDEDENRALGLIAESVQILR